MQDWLTGELPVDLRPDSVEFLRRLAVASEHRDQVERQLAVDAQLRAAQHANELVEVEDVLQQCGLAPHTLPNSITSSLDTLTSSAVALCTRDTALCSLYGAYDFLEAEQAQTRAAVQEEKELCSNLQSRLADCECMLQQLRNIESRYQEQTKREEPEQYVELQDKIILEKKSTQYKEDISRLKEELKRNGVRDKIYHSKILQESQAVLALHEQLVPLRASLESYKGLPPDLRLAKQHVKEARSKLETMEAELEMSIRKVVAGGLD